MATSPLDTVRDLLRRVLPGLWERRRLVLAVAWGVGLAGTAVVAALPDRFTSNARVYVDTQTLLKPLLTGLTVQPDLKQQLDIMRQTLMTRPNLEELARMADLDLKVGSPAEMEALVQDLKRDITFRTEGPQLFSIAYTHRDPRTAQKVVQSLLTIFVEQNLGSNRRDIEKTQRFIGEQIAEYEKRLRETEQRVADFRSRHAEQLVGKEEMARRLASAEAQARQTDTELQAAVWSRDQVGVELARTPRTLPAGQAGPAGLTPLQLAEQELAGLRLRFTDDHPDVRDARRKVDGLKAEGGARDAEAPAGPANPLHAELSAKAREAELKVAMLTHRSKETTALIAQVKAQLDQLPSLENELAALNRDYEVLRQNHQELIARRESARLAQQVGDRTQSVDYRVVDPPQVPITPSGPPRVLFMLAVVLAGLGAGLGAGLAALHMKSPFHDADQLRDAFGLDVIGTVTRTGPAPAVALPAIALAASLLVLLGLQGTAIALFGATEPLGGPVGEALRAARALWP